MAGCIPLKWMQVVEAVPYAQMVAADRELKLAGYQIFRFGAHELLDVSAADSVKRFFETLFKKYGVPVSL